MAKHRRLKQLRITRIDLVDRGANQDADVLLIKRDDVTKRPPAKEHDMLDLTAIRKHTSERRELRRAVDWIEDIYDGVLSAIKKQGEDEDEDAPGDRTFDEVMVQRSAHRVMQRVQEFAMVLDETIRRVVENTKAEHTEQKVKDAVASFVRAVKVDLPKFIDESMKGMAKAERGRLDHVVQLIGTGEPKMTDKKVDKKTDKKDDDKKPAAADMGPLRKMFAAMAKALGASDDDVATLDPEADGDIWKGVSPALRARIEESDRVRAEEVKKREAAEKRVAKLERDATLAEVRKEVATYKHMGLDPEKDVDLFERMTADLSEDQAKRMREIFKGADEAVEAGALFAEMGRTGLGDAPAGESADAEIEKRITGLMAKAENTKMTRDEAMDMVMREDPALYERYRKENAIRV